MGLLQTGVFHSSLNALYFPDKVLLFLSHMGVGLRCQNIFLWLP